jgi:hypothetical protein
MGRSDGLGINWSDWLLAHRQVQSQRADRAAFFVLPLRRAGLGAFGIGPAFGMLRTASPKGISIFSRSSRRLFDITR